MPKYDIVCEDTGVVLGFRETEKPLTPEEDDRLNKHGYLSEDAAKKRAEIAEKARLERLKLKERVLTEALEVIKNSPNPPDFKLLEDVSKEIQKDVQDEIAATPVKPDTGGVVDDGVLPG